MNQLDKAILLNKIQIALFVTLTICSASSLFFASNAKADCSKIYAKTGLGLKLDKNTFDRDYRADPYFIRLESGVECDNFTFGLTHGRQIYSDSEYYPVTDKYKTAVFIDYKFEWRL